VGPRALLFILRRCRRAKGRRKSSPPPNVWSP